MSRQRFTALLLFALASAATASSSGGYSGFVQRMGPGGAELSRGNTGIADPSALPAAYWNPAAASTLRAASLSVAGEWRSLDRHGGSLGGALPIGNRALFAYALLWRGDSHVKWIDEEDLDIGTLAPSWTTHYIGLGWRLSRSSGIGLTGQWRHWASDIDGESWSSPVSIGLSWYKEWSSRFSTGVVLRDLGIASGGIARFRQETPGEEGSGSDDFYPRTLVVGSRYTTSLLGFPFRMLLDIVDLQLSDRTLARWSDHELQGRTGIEWEPLLQGRLRAGWDDGNWAIGFGWTFESTQLASLFGKSTPSGEKKRRTWSLELDYQLLWERHSTFFNPLGFSLRWLF